MPWASQSSLRYRGAQLQCLGLLATSHVQRLLETGFRLAHIMIRGIVVNNDVRRAGLTAHEPPPACPGPARVTPAHRGAQLQCLGLLATSHVQRLLETGFRLAHIGARELAQQRPLETIQLGLPPPRLSCGHQREGVSQDGQPGLRLPRLARRFRQQGEKIGGAPPWGPRRPAPPTPGGAV